MNLLLDKLKQKFKSHSTLTKQELYDFYSKNTPTPLESDFFWYLYILKHENIIKAIYEDTYKLVNKNTINFEPFMDAKLSDINHLLSKFDLYDYCVWSSAWFNEFTTHQVPHSFIILEVEKEVTESVFYHLRDMGYKDVFLLLAKVDEVSLLDRYIFEAASPIIVRKIITKSPTKKILDPLSKTYINIPKLEKILVDLFCEDNLFRAYKGSEQFNIFENVLKKYTLNFKTLLAYAQRRKKDTQFKNYLFQNFQRELERILE
jgi:hypothetical protein